jgi:hypothetical protein
MAVLPGKSLRASLQTLGKKRDMTSAVSLPALVIG